MNALLTTAIIVAASGAVYWAIRASEKRAKITQQRIVDFLATRPAGASSVDIWHHLAAEKLSCGSVHVHIDKLEEEGRVLCWKSPGGTERGYRPKRMVAVVPTDSAEVAEGARR